MSRMAVSKHLKVLERAGLISRKIDGRVHRCALVSRRFREIDTWLSYYRAFWTANLDALAKFVETKDTSARAPSPIKRRIDD